MMRGVTSVILVVLALMMSIGVAVAEGPIPSDDSPTGYLHCESEGPQAEGLWINAVDDDNESVSSTHRSTTSTGIDEDWSYGFPLREGPSSSPVLENDMYLEEDACETDFRVRIEFAEGAPSEIKFQLQIDYQENIDEVVLDYSATGVYTGTFEIPARTVIEEDHTLDLHFNWSLSTGNNEWTLYLNEESYVDLPIALDTDDDGTPDYLDEDDDNDGYSDADEEDAGTDPLDSEDFPGADDNGNDDDDAFPGFEAPLVVTGIACIILLRRRR